MTLLGQLESTDTAASDLASHLQKEKVKKRRLLTSVKIGKGK